MSSLTLDVLARATGVSKSTMSRVLQQSDRVAPDLARQVREKLNAMGYVAPPPRRAPRGRKRQGAATGNLLLLVAAETLVQGYGMASYPQLFAGMDAASRENGLNLMLAGVTPSSELPAALAPSQVDGVLLFGQAEHLPPATINVLQKMPAVGLMRGFDQLNGVVDRVTYDNSMIGPLAAEHLARRGHKRVGFFNVFPNHSAMAMRQATFSETAQRLGLTVVPFVADREATGFREETALFRDLACRMCQGDDKITGCFVPQDFQIPPLYAALDTCGAEPGRDVEIVGCDNVAFFLDRLSPRPATIDINLELVGRRGVEQLIWRLSGPRQMNRLKITVEPTVIPGD